MTNKEKEKRKVTLSKNGKPLGAPPKYSEPTMLINFRVEISKSNIFKALAEFHGFENGVDYFNSLIDKERERARKKGFKK